MVKVVKAAKAQNGNASLSNSANAVAMLDKLRVQQVEWNEKHYKGTMDRLLALLGECLDVYGLLQKDKKARKVLDAKLKELELLPRDGLHLSTRVVRYVFRLTNSRAAAYARVLRAAAEARVEAGKLGSWVAEQGGIEAVRRMQKSGKTPAQTAAEKVEKVGDALQGANALLSIAKLPTQLHATDESFESYSIAIVRHNKQTGQGDIVWGTDNETLMKKVLLAVSKDVLNKHKASKAAKTAAAKRAERQAALEAPGNTNVADEKVAA